MKKAFALAVLLAFGLIAGDASAQTRARPLPLTRFVDVFIDPLATSAQKESELLEGTWYEGPITVSDVELYQKSGKEPARAEIKDWNYTGGCYLLLFRVSDTATALKLKVGDRIVVRGRLKNFGMNITKFTVGCETRFAQFWDCEILGSAMPAP